MAELKPGRFRDQDYGRRPERRYCVGVDLSWDTQTSLTETPAPVPQPGARRRSRWRALGASAALHLLLLLTMVAFHRTPDEPTGTPAAMTVTVLMEGPESSSAPPDDHAPHEHIAAWVAVEPHAPSRPASHRSKSRANAARESQTAEAAPTPPVEKPPLNANFTPLNASPKPLVWPPLTISPATVPAAAQSFVAVPAPPPAAFQFSAAPDRPPAPPGSVEMPAQPAAAAAAAHPPKDRQQADAQPSKGDAQARRDYAAMVQRTIMQSRDAQGDLIGRFDGKVAVKIEILADGALSAVTIVQSSGLTSVDNAIIEMFVNAPDLPPPPADVSAPVDMTFLLDLHSRR